MSNEYICHFGKKGQHWGERRWQYEDGSLTPAGRIHYGVGERKERNYDRLSEKQIQDRIVKERMSYELDRIQNEREYENTRHELEMQRVSLEQYYGRSINAVPQETKKQGSSTVRKLLIGGAAIGGVALVAMAGGKYAALQATKTLIKAEHNAQKAEKKEEKEKNKKET